VCPRRRTQPAIGFTLVEVLIVIIVIAVLAAIAVPKFAKSRQRAREAALKSNLTIVRKALEQFAADAGGYPVALCCLYMDKSALSALPYALSNSGTYVQVNPNGFRGPYLDGACASVTGTPLNPFGGVYSGYTYPSPIDPVSGAQLNYLYQGGKYKVVSSAAGSDSTGKAYSSY
jgi:prepilin-type N-terminal cleavage/methylation domain-containing protein